MSLYDDLDVKTRATENVSGWSSGIKLLQSQLQLKKAISQPKRDQQRKVSLAPVIDLKSKRDEDDAYPIYQKIKNEPTTLPTFSSSVTYGKEYDWNVDDEYDPLWPNEFDKVVKDIRENRERENDKEEKRRDRKRKSRFSDPEEPTTPTTPQMSQPPLASGFAGRWADEDDEIEPPPPKPRSSSGGAAIAPPPSLQDAAESSPIFPTKPQSSSSGNFGSSVAAKIMARYGFKEGQGLGKQEQGMSSALQVEKTSKRGGRIIHEKEILASQQAAAAAASAAAAAAAAAAIMNSPSSDSSLPSITEIIKNPSKVVLLKNMVGPGEVDDDLEPEVKDECNTKYGEVTSVIIHETQSENDEEAVRIFVEFRRIESAIKAVVDLNGRFFGGRQVKANFYDTEKFDNLQLMD